MIRECHIDSTLNHLSSTFGKRLIVRPPAGSDDIAGLEHLVGTLPRDFHIFLLTCDGLRVCFPDAARSDQWRIWHIREMMASILNPLWPCLPPSLVPLRGDPTAIQDCLVAGPTPVAGAVIRWDPWGQDLELLSSSFGRYLVRWADYLTERISALPLDQPTTEWPAFDANYIAEGDLELSNLQSQKSVSQWLSGMEQLVGSGDDFE